MRNKFYENESTVPLSNKILIAASILCVIATIVVFIFFNKHLQKKLTFFIPKRQVTVAKIPNYLYNKQNQYIMKRKYCLWTC